MRRAGTNYTCGNIPTLGGGLYGNLTRWCIVHNMVELCWTGDWWYKGGNPSSCHQM